MFTHTTRTHYTGITIHEWGWSLFGHDILRWWHSHPTRRPTDPRYDDHHRRLCVGTVCSFHLFSRKCNMLGGRGTEIAMSTLRYGRWLRWVGNWAVGRSDCRDKTMRDNAYYYRRVYRGPFGLAFTTTRNIPYPQPTQEEMEEYYRDAF